MNKSNGFVTHGVLIVIIIAMGAMLFKAYDPLNVFSSKKESVQKVISENKTTITEKQDDSLVLCRINGKPAITENEFINNITQMLNSNPYFRGAGLEALPAAIKRKFFDELIKQALIIENARKNNIENDPEFTKALNDMLDLVKRSLIVQFFEKKIFDKIDVTEKKVEQYFTENKEKYVKVNGGVLLASVSFDDEETAKSFLKKASEKIDNFEQLAKDESAGTFRDFGRVNNMPDQQAFRFETVPAQLKKAALASKNLPALNSIKIDNKHYVYKVSDKQETEYFSFDEVRSQVEGMIKNNEFKETLDERVNSMRSEYDVSINEDYFKDKNETEETEENSEESNTSGASAA